MTVAWEVRGCGTRPSSASYLASENIKRGTSAAEAEEAREGMEEMSEVHRNSNEKLYSLKS